ncbi:MAG: cation:proton antiporter [Actinomycetota bacterium]|nr:cation:proton antiporter [Actinomycetota bacterium]
MPRILRDYAVSTPMAFLGAGVLLGLVVERSLVDPVAEADVAERLTELTVIVALMGVGLAIDRPLSLRGWGVTWRLLLVTMPLCIAVVAVTGWLVAGLAPATALLLGAVLAPTDPVLASDVQVGGPTTGEGAELDEGDEVRFSLTTEAGLNDGLAFPFVWAALFWASEQELGGWLPRWIAWDLVGKVAIGAAVGAGAGWLLGKLAFEAPRPSLRLADQREPMLSLAATLGVYGLAEVLHGYGFVAVFAAALAIRAVERDHDYHGHLHTFIGQLEHILTWTVLLLIGVAISGGLFSALTWPGVVVGATLVLLVRPVAGWLSLAGTGCPPAERWTIAGLGVRGIGSLYYLAYAGDSFRPELPWLWATVGFTVALSVVVHGTVATPVMRALGREPAAT